MSRPAARRTTRTTLTLAATMGLALGACTGVGDEPVTPATTPDTDAAPTTAATPEESAPVVASVDTPDLDTECVLEPDVGDVDRVVYAVPADWQVDGRCDVLDPDLSDLPEDTEVDAAIFVSTSAVAFAETREPSETQREVETWLGARAGRQAVRSTYVATGAGLTEEGQPGTSWAYDLDAGTDDTGGVLTLATGSVEGEDYALAQATLDAIAGTVVVQPGAPLPAAADEGTFPVTRVEGGATPWTVTWDGQCFALRPSVDAAVSAEQCDLDPTAGPLVAGHLGDDVVVGFAPSSAIGVAAATAPHALTLEVEGGNVFALRSDELPTELTAIGPGGEELVTAPVS